MTISVTEFKARCLEILRELERSGQAVEIERRGRVVARVIPVAGELSAETPPWRRLRGTGRLLAAPEESVLSDGEFEANR
jgi:antitoxin (DNA-binding transcriptional repressor) of toxin-antitoxin stability system